MKLMYKLIVVFLFCMNVFSYANDDTARLNKECDSLSKIMNYKYELILSKFDKQEIDTFGISGDLKLYLNYYRKLYGNKEYHNLINGKYYQDLKKMIINDQKKTMGRIDSLSSLYYSINFSSSMSWKQMGKLNVKIQFLKLRIRELELIDELFLKEY